MVVMLFADSEQDKDRVLVHEWLRGSVVAGLVPYCTTRWEISPPPTLLPHPMLTPAPGAQRRMLANDARLRCSQQRWHRSLSLPLPMPPAKLARDDLKSLSSAYTLCEARSVRYRGLPKNSANIADDGLPMLVLASLLIFEQSLPTLCVSGSIWKRWTRQFVSFVYFCIFG